MGKSQEKKMGKQRGQVRFTNETWQEAHQH
jgi:hypothetical protein